MSENPEFETINDNDLFENDLPDPVASDTGTENTEMGSFLPDDEEVDLGVAPEQIVTIRTSSGGSHYVGVTEPITLRDLKMRSNLTYGSGVQFFLDNALIDDATVIPMGATVSAVGNVKGGTL